MSSVYQRVEKPLQTFTRGDALKEYAISTTIGR
jgi:hypothetical protein